MAVTTPLAAAAEAMPVMGVLASVGGFMHVPVLAPVGDTQVRPCPAQHALAPLTAEVQPAAPAPLQAVGAAAGRARVLVGA